MLGNGRRQQPRAQIQRRAEPIVEKMAVVVQCERSGVVVTGPRLLVHRV